MNSPEIPTPERKDLKDMTKEELWLRRRELGNKLNGLGTQLDELLIEYQAIEEELDVMSDWVSNE